jgi:uncharacterized membrane protein
MNLSWRNTLTHIFKFIWSLFLNGLFTILPMTLTIAIFIFSYRLFVSWLQPLHLLLLHYETSLPRFLHVIPHSEIWVSILGILIVGALVKFFLLHIIIGWIEILIAKIPLVNTVYSGIKQLVHAFSPQEKNTFKTVVMIEFPRKGMYSIGFYAGDMPASHSPNKQINFANVFVPTTPNPSTGFFLILPKDELIIIEMSRQEAMALIISGGIIQPKTKVEKPVE